MYLFYDKNKYESENFGHNIIVKDAARQLRTRGIMTKIVSTEEEVMEKLKSKDDCLFIPYSFGIEFHSLLVYCNQKNIPVMTVHVYPQYFPDCTYNTITRDPYGSMRTILAYFIYNKGKNCKISYFGMTPNTMVDQAKMNALYSLYSPMKREDYYFNDKGFIDCFNRFYEHRKEYDAIVCANTRIAIAFFTVMNQRDPETAKRLMVVSFMSTKLSMLCHTPITIFAYDQNSIYDAVSSMNKCIKKQEYIMSMNFTLKTRFIIRESTRNMLCPPDGMIYDITSKYNFGNRSIEYEARSEKCVKYVEDPYLKDIVAIENLLDSVDELDLKIILLFLNNATNNDVSSKLYISIQTIQYRTRIMYKILNVVNKEEFIKILLKYIDLKRFQSFVLNLSQRNDNIY